MNLSVVKVSSEEGWPEGPEEQAYFSSSALHLCSLSFGTHRPFDVQTIDASPVLAGVSVYAARHGFGGSESLGPGANIKVGVAIQLSGQPRSAGSPTSLSLLILSGRPVLTDGPCQRKENSPSRNKG